jgi:hypothetical protein
VFAILFLESGLFLDLEHPLNDFQSRVDSAEAKQDVQDYHPKKGSRQ